MEGEVRIVVLLVVLTEGKQSQLPEILTCWTGEFDNNHVFVFCCLASRVQDHLDSARTMLGPKSLK